MPKKKNKRKSSKKAPLRKSTPIDSPASNPTDQLVNDGRALYLEGQWDAAQDVLAQAIEIDPNRADAHSLIGVTLLAQGSHQGAAAQFQTAIELDPDVADYRFNLALALFILRDLKAAENAARAALVIRPEYPEAWNTLGMIFNEREDWTSARNSFEKATLYGPDYAVGWINLCGALQELGEYEEAIKCGRRGVELAPNVAQAHYNLARCYDANGDYDKAIEHSLCSLEIEPDNPNALSNLSRTYLSNNEFSKGEETARKALEISPTDLDAMLNIGLSWFARGDCHSAIEMYLKILAQDPEFIRAHNNLAHAYLTLENFTAGWEEYEWGILAGHRVAPVSDAPAWQGEPVAGKHLNVVGEQGIGEQIMFSTMIKDLLDEGAKVTFECEKRLVPLYQRAWPDIEIIPLTHPPDPRITNGTFDYATLVGSIGRWRRNAVSDFTPQDKILQADPQLQKACRDRYEELGDGPIIGISWKSMTMRHHDRKNISLDYWRPIFEAAQGATFVCLQYGDVDEDIQFAKDVLGIELYKDEHVSALDSLEESAAQIAAMDMVISISNATVHLAGALGIPTSVMVSPAPLWHWFNERDDSLWYKSVQIFRRSEGKTWDQVTEKVANSLPSVLAQLKGYS